MKWWRKTPKPEPQPEPEWTDPLNPHGDGTLRPGDPVFDAMMRGHAVHGNFGADGWTFNEINNEDEDAPRKTENPMTAGDQA